LRIKLHSPIIEPPNNSLRGILCAKGLKSTKGRKIILKELETQKEHFNAESLYSGLSQKKQRVSKPTIYRTLKLLDKLRLIERFDIKKNCFYYEPMLHRREHGHLICEACGKIIDFYIEDLDRIKSAIIKEKDFTLGCISIRAFGLCQNCLKVTKPQRDKT
jgi:Fur family ferric uptake transcriptional regulator